MSSTPLPSAQDIKSARDWFQGLGNSELFENFDIEGLVSKIAYKGFNAEIIRAAFFRAASKAGDPVADLLHLIILGMERGANVTNMTNRMDPEGKKVVNELVSRYQLKSRASGASQHTLTLPRICLAFPYHSCCYANNYRKNKIFSVNVPGCMTVQPFSSLIPAQATKIVSSDVVDMIKAVHIRCMSLLTQKIGPKDSAKRELADLDAESERYVDLGMLGSPFNEATKIQILTEFEVISTKGGINKQVQEMYESIL
ncbi:nucleocapsid [Dar es Salaam virus TZ-189]|uniref:Nucleoprotein n=1 Tax=Dar es Salaam virus TZ-189 TaxID=2576944 RepID=A0A4Y6JJM1_9VIRU|nr:nucleocapsid [Dar es Salaam virus TZ-189]QDF82062.1 nucleocapsid [Dar es Salaam virus TZ-189]